MGNGPWAPRQDMATEALKGVVILMLLDAIRMVDAMDWFERRVHRPVAGWACAWCWLTASGTRTPATRLSQDT